MIIRRLSISLVLAFGAALLIAGRASAIDIGKLLSSEHGPDKFRVIHVQDLARMMAASGHRIWIYDANHPSLREKAGIIPGAHLLTSYGDYDLSELTPDKSAPIVFYCADLH